MTPFELFKKEKAMVYSALKHEEGEIKLRKHLVPLVESISEHYALHHHIPKKELMQIGWTHFEFALVNYKRRMQKMVQHHDHAEQVYSFGLYFVWYIQQSIETYLGIAKQPLTGIVPKNLPEKK